MLSFKNIFLSLLALLLANATQSQPEAQIPLWPNGAPGSIANGGNESMRIYEPTGDHIVSNIHKPSIIPYLPSPDNNTGIAVVIAPGGGHREIWIDHEGHNVAKMLQQKGIASFILKYRLANYDSTSTYTVEGHSVVDMQRAIRLVKSRVAEWGINPEKIGIMGFSAGGQIAALTDVMADNGNPNANDPVDTYSSKPAFQVLGYPAWTNDITITDKSAPAFILGGYQDHIEGIATGIAELYLKFKAVNVPAELHIFANAGHGFGIRTGDTGPSAHWPELLVNWLYDMNGLEMGK